MTLDENVLGKTIKDNLLWVDVVKGIAIILVILGHSHPPKDVANFIFLFHMPLFFLIAGYLFNYEKYKDNFITLFKLSAKRLLLPALITCLVFYDFNRYNFIIRLKMILYGIGKPFPELGINSLSFAVWFVLCLFLVRILLWGFLKTVKKFNIPVYVNILLAFLIASLGVYISKYIKLPWSLDIAMVALYIAYIGFLFKEYNFFDKKLINIFVCILAVILAYFDFKYYGLSMNDRYYSSIPFISLNAAIGLCVILIFISKLVAKIKYVNSFFQYLGINSLIIMLVHIVPYSSNGYLQCTLFRLFISVIFIEILALIPNIKEIFSAKSIICPSKFLR